MAAIDQANEKWAARFPHRPPKKHWSDEALVLFDLLDESLAARSPVEPGGRETK